MAHVFGTERLALMLIPIDEVVHFDVVCHAPSTGGVSDADSAPTFDVFEEATDTAILDDQTMTKRTSLTGNYRGTFTASAANGFEAGKWYNVVASATVSSISAKKVCLTFRIAPAESSAGVPKVDTSHVSGTAQTGGDLKTLIDAKASQTSVDDLPTNAELATSQAAADDATLAAIAALNNLSSAQAQTAAAAALTAYDPPTNAEMEARTLAAASYATASALDVVDNLLDTEIAAIVAAIAALNNISASDVLTQVNTALETAVADSIPADGSRPSIKQGIYLNTQFLLERSVSGTTLTIRKPDGSTALLTLTLSDATSPTSITRAT